MKKLQVLSGYKGSRKNVLVNRLIARLKALSRNEQLKHMTLISFYGKPVVALLRKFSGSGVPSDPVVNGTDMQNVLVVLPFVLYDIVSTTGSENISESDGHRLKEVFKMIEVVNLLLQWYLQYRSPQMSENELCIFHKKSKELMKQLKGVFDCTTGDDGSGSSKWKTEKFHSLQHAARNIRYYGNLSNFSTQTPEMLHKYTRELAKLTNRKRDFARSILRTAILHSCAQRLAQQHDASGTA